MTYDPRIHNRQSLRLKGYDYSKAGLYFITICCQNQAHMFGEIIDGKMILNDAGKMIEKWFFELENKYPDKECHEMIIMPNHMHFILENMDTPILDFHTNEIHAMDAHAGTSLRGRPSRGDIPKTDQKLYESQINDSHESIENLFNEPPYGSENKKYQSPLGDAIGWFKTMTTNEYIRGVKTLNWKRFDKKLWQRSYHDHIIRNGYAYYNISKYIKENPGNWKKDKFRN
jgi:putative transposase